MQRLAFNSRMFGATTRVLAVFTALCALSPGIAASAPAPPAEASVPASAVGPQLPPGAVRIDAETTATKEVWRNPDGSRTAALSPRPVRSRDAQGVWRPIDMTLVTNADGSASPTNAPLKTRLAASSSAAALTIETSAGRFDVRQPGASGAKAQIAKDKATYPRALSGGRDLVVQVRVDGFEETVMVPNARAGASYADEFDLPAGVTARQGEKGVEFVDGAGAVVSTFGDGVAWDATFPRSASSLTPVSVRLVSQAPGIALVEVAVDPAWLSAVERVFPVTVDPDFVQATQPGISGPRDAFVYGAPEYASYGFDHILDTLWVGNYPRAPGRVDPTRTFMWFDLSSLPTIPAGGYVNYSYLFLYDAGYGSNCTSQIMDLYRLKVPWGSSLNWNTQPTDSQVEWFGYGSWKHGGTGSACPASRYEAIDTTLLAKMWLSGAPSYANNGLELRARNEADPEGFKLLVAGDVPSNNPNVPVLLVNYITPTLQFSEDVVYTGVDNTGTLTGTGFLPNASYDIYWDNPDASKQYLQSVTADGNGAIPPTIVTIRAVGPPTSLSSTGYLHAFQPGLGTDPLWCVATRPTTVTRSDPDCPETPQQLNAHFNPGTVVRPCFDDAWPSWMVNAFNIEDLKWRLTSSGSPQVMPGGSCGLGDTFRLRFRSSANCAGIWYACTELSLDGTGRITNFILTVNSSYCQGDDNGNRTFVASQCFDIQTTLGHELGHVRGLDHTTERPDCTIMVIGQQPLPYKHRNPLVGDYKAMKRIYGP